MENFTFVGLSSKASRYISHMALLLILGLVTSFKVSPEREAYSDKRVHGADVLDDGISHTMDADALDIGVFNMDHSFDFKLGFGLESSKDSDGDGVTDGKEDVDGTDPHDACSFILAHQDCTPSEAWKKDDCDGDGVTNQKEKEDNTDPLDPCDFILAHQNCTPSYKWKKDDCDGDGVTNGKEKEDGTDPLDPCDFILAHQDCTPSYKWKKDDCDGDGVTNGKEKEDGTDPLDPCDFILDHQDCTPSEEWKKDDCDGDGVTNEDEKEDGTDPLEPCDYNPDSITLPQSGDYLEADCDGDGVTNEDEIEDGTDPNDSCDFLLGSQTVDPSSTWNGEDCDGDGVTNGDEKEDGTDPLDPCDYNPDHITLPQSGDYLEADCDGDGVTNEDEIEDGTDPNDSCDFVLGSQTVDPSSTWNGEDCDGDGVTNGDEKEDGTDPLDPCDYNPEHITLPQSGDYLEADCDGDGVTNEDEIEDGTDPNDPCDFVLGSQTVDPSSTWNGEDCDGDGVTNGDEKEDGTDPLDPCDYNPDSITLTPSADWELLDCDDDGNPNGTDPNPLAATAVDDSGATPALTEVAINILENDDYLPNSDENNLGITSLSRIGGNAVGTVSFDAETGLMTYTPTLEESNSSVTIVYEVCNVVPDPAVCASATVTIEVGPNTIDAVDDFYTADGSVGGVIADSNVLSNDTLNGGPIALEDVNLSSTATDELTINSDGTISVAPGTSDGTYTIEYTICEAANPSNCDTATVTVEVESGMGNAIDAVDDSYTADGSVGGVIADSNVLSNDTLNGGPIALEDVNLSSTATNELTINSDGTISVAPGTSDGTYTIEYTICEAANPSNCDTATVTVEVESGMGNVIDAVDDSYTADGSVGGVIADSNVLSNDTLNGESVTLENVLLSSTPTDELTVNDDGSISVTPGTPVGTYTVDYTICDITDVENCDTATVTVEVGPGMGNDIDAVDDSYTADGSVGGVIADSNVLSNDTLNGESVTLEDVLLSSTPTDELMVNDDGSVSVTPGTPEGTYTVDYTICDITDVDNCNTATVTVVVELGMDNVIDAMDDGYTSDSIGGLIPDSNVLGNDTLNEEIVDAIDVILTSTPTGELRIEQDGSVIITPGLEEGTYTIEYTICEAANPENCDTATVTVSIEDILVNQLVTPNGDLKNDFLFIRGTDKIKSSTLKIFNRWGTAVYEGKDYNNINNVFDGRSRTKSAVGNNNYLPAGVYFYIFEYVTDRGRFTDSEYIYISR